MGYLRHAPLLAHQPANILMKINRLAKDRRPADRSNFPDSVITRDHAAVTAL
jgi:hypothetical protein